MPPSINLVDWLLHWQLCGDVFASQFFCSMLWKVWDARNKLSFENKNFMPSIIANNAARLICDFNEANHRPTPQTEPIPAVANWFPPQDNWTKLNVDAGCFKYGCLQKR